MQTGLSEDDGFERINAAPKSEPSIDRHALVEIGPDISRISEGCVGDKAEQLVSKTEFLRSIGFRTPERIVLADGFFAEFFQRHGLGVNLSNVEPNDQTIQTILQGSFSEDEVNVITDICSSFAGSPIAVRSSAQGDARGTGTYTSEFTGNVIREVLVSIKKVLASYFSPSAVAFRQDALTGDGFGIIIEPIVGNNLKSGIAPILSGYGYTSTSRGAAYISVVPGLGGGVESLDGERLTRTGLEEYNGKLIKYCFMRRAKLSASFRRTELLEMKREENTGLRCRGYSFGLHSQEPDRRVDYGSLHFDEDIGKALLRLDVLPLFTMIEELETHFCSPQYFEFALTIENEEPVFWITQIAEVNKKLDIMDFAEVGDHLFSGHTVTGTGEIVCNKVVTCWNPSDVSKLNQFNKENEGYLLIFSSRLTTRGAGNEFKLTYSDFSNASVFLEIQDAGHSGDPVAHLGGQLDMTRKLFAVLDYASESRPNWGFLQSVEENKTYGINVYHGKVSVIASERQNRLVVSKLNDI